MLDIQFKATLHYKFDKKTLEQSPQKSPWNYLEHRRIITSAYTTTSEKCESLRAEKAKQEGKKSHLTPLLNDLKILDTCLELLDTYITTKTLGDIP